MIADAVATNEVTTNTKLFRGLLADHCQLFCIVPMAPYDKNGPKLPRVSIAKHSAVLVDFKGNAIQLKNPDLKSYYGGSPASSSVHAQYAVAMSGTGMLAKAVKFNYELNFVHARAQSEDLETAKVFDLQSGGSIKMLTQWVYPMMQVWAKELYPEQEQVIDALNKLNVQRGLSKLLTDYPGVLDALFERFPNLEGVRHNARIEIAPGRTADAVLTTLRYNPKKMKFIRAKADPDTFIVSP